MEEKKMSAPMVEDRNAQGDAEKHQTYYITPIEVTEIFEKVILHNCMKNARYKYAFEYNPIMYDGRIGELTLFVQVRKTPSIEYAIKNGTEKMEFFGVFTTDEAAQVIEMIEADMETYDD